MPNELADVGEDEVSEIYENVHDLTDVFTVKSYDDLTQVLNEHYFCKDVTETDNAWEDTPAKAADSKPAEETTSEAPAPATSDDDPLNDDKVKELLKGLE